MFDRLVPAVVLSLSLTVLSIELHAQTADTPPVPKQPLEILPGEYPLESLLNNEEGTVGLNLIVNSDGRVSIAQITSPSGSPRLDAAAVNVAKTRWQFQPALSNGQAVTSQLMVSAVLNEPLEPPFEYEMYLPDIPVDPSTAVLVPPVPLQKHTVTARDYPGPAIHEGEQGEVGVRYAVIEDGTVGETELILKSGYALLDQAAVDLVKRWTFRPATINDRPVKFWAYVRVVYSLGFNSLPVPPQRCTAEPELDEKAGIGDKRTHINANGTIDDVILRTRKGWMRVKPPLLQEFAAANKFPAAAYANRTASCWSHVDIAITPRAQQK